MLFGGLGVGAGLLTGCQSEVDPGGNPDELVLNKPPAAEVAPVTLTRKLSSARYREVDMLIIRPAGIPVTPIPVCVALCGGLTGAKSFVDLGVPDMLTRLVKGGVPPFAIVAVDGGNWIGHKDDDPLRMLNEDLPAWLDYHDLASTPFSALGIAQGGAGALNFARSPGLQVLATISPTLFETWDDARPTGEFREESQWVKHEPLRHITEFTNLPLGIWCGTEDKDFLRPAKSFAEQVTADRTSFTPGGHDDAYWTAVLPEALKFIGGYL